MMVWLEFAWEQNDILIGNGDGKLLSVMAPWTRFTFGALFDNID